VTGQRVLLTLVLGHRSCNRSSPPEFGGPCVPWTSLCRPVAVPLPFGSDKSSRVGLSRVAAAYCRALLPVGYPPARGRRPAFSNARPPHAGVTARSCVVLRAQV